jgi:hypothetical protein
MNKEKSYLFEEANPRHVLPEHDVEYSAKLLFSQNKPVLVIFDKEFLSSKKGFDTVISHRIDPKPTNPGDFNSPALDWPIGKDETVHAKDIPLNTQAVA